MSPFFRELLSQAAFLGAMLLVVSVVFTLILWLANRAANRWPEPQNKPKA